jgi:broad specificity phosphatase PhoE
MAAGTPIPLDDSGRAQARAWGDQFAQEPLKFVYASGEVTSQETAAVFADAAGARVKTIDGLEEVGCGLWEGLSEETIKQRFPKVYKRWREDPSAVTPPDGESLLDADSRLRQALARVRDRGNGHTVGIVLGPTACALVRCRLEGATMSSIRTWMANEPVVYPRPPALDRDLEMKGAGVDASE